MLNYYHPSTTVFVDDQQAFLSAVKNRLPKDMISIYFSDPRAALNKIKSAHFSQRKNLQRIYEVGEDLEINLLSHSESLFNLKVGEASKQIYNPDRFSEISVVIVDRMMPILDGINFCRQLSDHPVKKVMLTASKDRKIATEAFNEGIIDFFLVKDAPNLVDQLITIIDKMQKNYFYSLSKKTLGSTLEMAIPLINSPFIIDFLKNKMHELGAVEFYLLDKQGSVLLLTYDGTPKTLAISSGEMIDMYAAIAQEHEELSIANTLFKKEKLLFLPKEIDSMRPVGEWRNFLFDAISIPEQPNLFYALIKNPRYQPVDIEKIYPREKYAI